MESVSVHIAVLSVASGGEVVAMENIVADGATAAGHQISAFETVRDSEVAIRAQLVGWIEDDDVDVVIIVGDGEHTSAALEPLVDQTLPGFADLLRMLAFQEIGASAMLSSAEAARCKSTFVFVLPSGEAAVKAAMEKLILPQLDPKTKPRNLIASMPRLRAGADVTKADVTRSDLGDVTKVDVAKPAETRKPPAAGEITRVDIVPAATRAQLTAKTPAGTQTAIKPVAPEGPPRRRSSTGANIIARNPPSKVDDPTKPIELVSLEHQLELSKSTGDTTKPMDLSKLPKQPPGAKPLSPVIGGPKLPSVVKPAEPAQPKPVTRAALETRPLDIEPKKPAPRLMIVDDEPSAGVRQEPPPERPVSSAPVGRPKQPTPARPSPAYSSEQTKTYAAVSSTTPKAERSLTPAVGSPWSSTEQGETGAITRATPPAGTRTESRSPWSTKSPARATPPAGSSTREQPGSPWPSGSPSRATPPTGGREQLGSPWPSGAPTRTTPTAGWASRSSSASVPSSPPSEQKPEATKSEPFAAAKAFAAGPAREAEGTEAKARVAAAETDEDEKLVEAKLAELAAWKAASAEAASAEAVASKPAASAPVPIAAPRTRPPTPPPPPPIARPTGELLPLDDDDLIPIPASTSEAPLPSRRSQSDLPAGAFVYPTQIKRSKAPLLIVLLFALAGIGAAAYFLVLKKDDTTPPSEPVAAAEPAIDAAVIEEPVAVIEVDAAAVEIDAAPAVEPTPPPDPTPPPVTSRPTPRAQTPRVATPRTTPDPPSEPAEQPAAPTPPKPADDPGCDEVSCVMEKYARPCCAKYKPADSTFQPSAGSGENLEKAQIKAGIDRVRPRVIDCGTQHKDAKGTVKVGVSVDPEGVVTEVDVKEAPDDALGSCVASAVRKAKFAKTTNGGSFTYPFVFQ